MDNIPSTNVCQDHDFVASESMSKSLLSQELTFLEYESERHFSSSNITPGFIETRTPDESQSQAQNSALQPRKKFFCDECVEGFTRRADRKRHIESIHGKRRFFCGCCHNQRLSDRRPFKRSYMLDKHLREKHGMCEKGSFECCWAESCGKLRFVSEACQLVHHAKEHGQDLAYPPGTNVSCEGTGISMGSRQGQDMAMS